MITRYRYILSDLDDPNIGKALVFRFNNLGNHDAFGVIRPDVILDYTPLNLARFVGRQRWELDAR